MGALTVIAAIAATVASLVVVARAGRDTGLHEPLAPPRPPDVPDRLRQLERAVEAGAAYAGDLHLSLRPVLRTIAAERLRRRGVELDDPEGPAPGLLGDELWELVRPGRTPTPEAYASGPGRAAVERLIARLETL